MTKDEAIKHREELSKMLREMRDTCLRVEGAIAFLSREIIDKAEGEEPSATVVPLKS